MQKKITTTFAGFTPQTNGFLKDLKENN